MATPLNHLFKRGYSSVYALFVEGIPFLFVEKIPSLATSSSAPTAPTDRTVVAGLIIDKQKLSLEIDRESGIGRGRAIDFRLAYQDMKDAGYLDDIFARPTLEVPITADATATATTISAANTGFPASGAFYLGREYIKYGNKNGSNTAFEACTRAVLGYNYVHSAKSIASSRYCTNKPLVWRGRFVTLKEYIVDPAGRMLDTSWSSGTYQREIWKGYIGAPPKPLKVAMSLNCLPLCRLLGNPLGFSVEWQDNRKLESPWKTHQGVEYIPFYSAGTEKVSVTVAFTGTSAGGAGSPSNPSPLSIDVLCPTGVSSGYFSDPELYASLLGSKIADAVQAAGLTEFEADGVWDLFKKDVVAPSMGFSASSPVTLQSVAVMPGSAAPYFLQKGVNTSEENLVIDGSYVVTLPFTKDFGQGINPWLIVNANNGVLANDFDISAPGIGLLSSGGVEELVTWDQVVSLPLSRVAIHINARGVGGTPIGNPGLNTFTLKSGSGHVGLMKESLYTVLMSSGTGTRGTGDYAQYDSMAEGFGAGIPQEYLDTESIDELHYKNFPSTCVQGGAVSVGDLLGGWVALSGNCIVDYRSSGVIKLKAVTSRTGEFSALANETTTINMSDVMLNRLEDIDVIDPPNPVTVDTASISAVGAKVTVRDAPAIQEQTAHPAEFKAPGMDVYTAISSAREMIWLGTGQYAIKITVGLWVDVQAGDPVILGFTHPGIYDWQSGSPGPTSVSGRVTAWSRDLGSGTQTLTILLNGVKDNAGLLCPVAIVAGAPSGNTVTITSGIEWFQAGETVIIYNRGNEALGTPEFGALIIQSIDTSANTITFTSTPAAWVAANTRITYPQVTSASSDQDDFFYNNADYKWSG